MKKVLQFASLAEGGTGAALLAFPPIVVRLLLGAEIGGAGIWVCRLTGISLIALAIACWPGKDKPRAVVSMFTYSTLVMLCFMVAGLSGMAGILLWPAVAFHGVLSLLLVWAWYRERTRMERHDR